MPTPSRPLIVLKAADVPEVRVALRKLRSLINKGSLAVSVRVRYADRPADGIRVTIRSHQSGLRRTGRFPWRDVDDWFVDHLYDLWTSLLRGEYDRADSICKYGEDDVSAALAAIEGR